MSVDNLKKYGMLCAQDEAVREKAQTIGLQDVGGQIAYATSLGLPFSQEDMAALARGVGAIQSDELSEEDLEKVAGGDFVPPGYVMTIAAGAGVAASTAVAVSAAAAAGAVAGGQSGWRPS